MKRLLALGLLAAGIVAPAAHAEWKPAGPITLHIGFKVAGGTDIQARLIGEALTEKKGWRLIYKNITGKGGANLARALKGGAADGLALGMAETSTFTYQPLRAQKIGYGAGDFDYIITTAKSQTGLVVRADRGWKTMDDMIKATQGGKRLKLAIMSARLGDAAHLIADKYDFKYTSVKSKGGRGVLNALMARDVDAGFIAGIQVKGVQAGDLVNVLSVETSRLAMSPDAPTLKEVGIPYGFGSTFVVVAPKGVAGEARNAIAAAIKEVLSDKNSKARKFVQRTFGAPPLVSGAALDKQIADEIADSKKLLAAIK